MRRRPKASKLTKHQWETWVKPLALEGWTYKEISEHLFREHGVTITGAAIGYRIREEGWRSASKVEDKPKEEAKSNRFKNLATVVDVPLTPLPEDAIVRRRCDKGHVWMGPSKRVVAMECPICSIPAKER